MVEFCKKKKIFVQIKLRMYMKIINERIGVYYFGIVDQILEISYCDL